MRNGWSAVPKLRSGSRGSHSSSCGAFIVALIIARIGMPFVLLYTTGVYYIFRGQVRVEPSSY